MAAYTILLRDYRLPAYSLLAFVLLVFTCPVIASSATEGAEHSSHWMDWVWRVINFAILLIVLIKFLAKPMKNYFRKRTELIEKSLKEAREAKELAQKALMEVEEKLRLKDKEIEHILSSARRTGEAERESLTEQGREMGEKIKEQARNNIEMELRSAMAALQAEAADLAIGIAEKKLKERLTEDEQLKIVDESIRKIEG